MRRNSRSPQIIQWVEFTKITLDAQLPGKMMQFVIMLESSKFHAVFVQRREGDRIDVSRRGSVHAAVQQGQHRGASCGSWLGPRHLGSLYRVHFQKCWN